MYCEKCGEKNLSESKFCKSCGYVLKDAVVRNDQKTEKDKERNWFLENIILSKRPVLYIFKGFLSGFILFLYFGLSDYGGKNLGKGDFAWIPTITLIAYWIIITIGYFTQIKLPYHPAIGHKKHEKGGMQVKRFLIQFCFAILLTGLIALISYLIAGYNGGLKFENIFFVIVLLGFVYTLIKKSFRITSALLLVTAIGIWGFAGPAEVTTNSTNPNTTQVSVSCNEQTTIQQVKNATHTVNIYDRNDNYISYGSGIALDSPTKNLVLTNYHVIEGANKIKVWDGFNGRGMVDATSYATYPDQDIAIVKVENAFPYTITLLDSNQVKDAETLYALGWPNDPSGAATITKGILSRRIKEDGFEILQTDASINPGNSGGPLVNNCGVIGMNTAKMSWSDYQTPSEGTGYALSSNFINSVILKK